jgi:hypothetical protein
VFEEIPSFAIGHDPQPEKPNPYSHNVLLKMHINIILMHAHVFQANSSRQVFHPIFCVPHGGLSISSFSILSP